MNVETIAAVVEDLQKHERRPSREMDARIHEALAVPAAEGGEIPAYPSATDAAIGLIPLGWRWHFSHLEAEVMPTDACPGVPMSNAGEYHFNGRPLGYGAMLMGSRALIPSAVGLAVLRARLAQLLKAAAVRDGRMYLVQTGNGPWIADLDGRLKEMPAGAWLSDEGEMIARKDAFPQYSFQEPEEDEEDRLFAEDDRIFRAIDDLSEKLRELPGVKAVAADYERRLAVVVTADGESYGIEFGVAEDAVACSLAPYGKPNGGAFAAGHPDHVYDYLRQLCV
jgi:hypothetical protein